jgi:hypothetical protein
MAAFLARMLSRSAVFFDGFSMGARLPAWAAGAAFGSGRFFVSAGVADFLVVLAFFGFSMGSLGGD